MIRRLALLFAFFVSVTVAFAQSMSDSQVTRFILQEKEKGTTEQQIVQKLLQKGVTVEQLRRIRKQYEAEQNQPGAIDLTGSTQQQGTNRLRTSKEKESDLNQQRNGYMIRSRKEINEQRYLPRDERQQMLTDEVGFMDIDSIIYYQNYFRDENQVFGRNIFNNPALTFEPAQNMATPANYRLGPGDNVIIDVWGASQETFSGSISPDGVIVIDGVGPIKLAGLTVQQAKSTISSTLGRYYSDCNFSIAVGEVRSIQVQVMGEVNVPGTYTLSSLSSAFNALYAAGGINDIGTLRSIKVYRGGKLLSEIDVYDYLLNGNSKSDVHLADNDVIVVGPYDCLVSVRGKVKRPMNYEMKGTESVQQLLAYAGGFTGDAYTDNVTLTRKKGAEYSIHTIGEFQRNAFTLADGDSLYVDSVIARYSNMVEIRGAVMHPGQYQMSGDIQSVRDLLRAAGGLREDAFQSRAVMHREKDDLSLEMVSVNVEGLLDGSVADVALKKNDVLFIPSTVDMRGEQTLTIDGEVLYPGIYQFAENTQVEDLILQAGGLTPAASLAKVDVFRRIRNNSATESNDVTTETYSFSLNENMRSGDLNFTLQPYDEVYVRKSPAYGEQQNVTIKGCVNFAGKYAMVSKNYRLSDLVQASGGLSSIAYAKGARLTRKLTEEERIQRENALRAAQIQMYEEAMESESKNYDMARADSLLSLKLDLGDNYPVAVNLDKALAEPGGIDDIVLRDGDELVIPQYTNTVKVSGEVTYPISMNYEKNHSVRYYIRHAGGYGNRAKKSGVYAIYMNGSVEKVNLRSKKAVQPGCEIVVPTRQQTKKMTTGEVMAIASGAASLASVIVALLSIIRK